MMRTISLTVTLAAMLLACASDIALAAASSPTEIRLETSESKSPESTTSRESHPARDDRSDRDDSSSDHDGPSLESMDDKPPHKPGPGKPALFDVTCEIIETNRGLFVVFTNESAVPIPEDTIIFADLVGSGASIGKNFLKEIASNETVKIGPLDPKEYPWLIGHECEAVLKLFVPDEEVPK